MNNPVDSFIGAQLRKARISKGLTMKQVAESIGASQQQYQRYEVGKNAIKASMLILVARALQLPLDQFTPTEERLDEYDTLQNISGTALKLALQYDEAIPTVQNTIKAILRGGDD